jgi:hypothetical protein
MNYLLYMRYLFYGLLVCWRKVLLFKLLGRSYALRYRYPFAFFIAKYLVFGLFICFISKLWLSVIVIEYKMIYLDP